jgi:hypothetical protein
VERRVVSDEREGSVYGSGYAFQRDRQFSVNANAFRVLYPRVDIRDADPFPYQLGVSILDCIFGEMEVRFIRRAVVRARLCEDNFRGGQRQINGAEGQERKEFAKCLGHEDLSVGARRTRVVVSRVRQLEVES